MADINEELRVLVTAEVDKAIKNLKSVDKQTDATEKMFKQLGGAIGAAFSVKAVVDFSKQCADAYREHNQTVSVLRSTLEATGATAWTTAQELQNMAQTLQGATNFTADSINSMQSVLLGFRNITGDTFEEATKAILDMATVMKMDLSSAAQSIGKALDDPIHGMDSLKKQGFNFTAAQKKVIQSFLDVGDAASAQKIILDELNGTFGGAAEAAADSATQIKNAWDDVKVAIAEGLVDTVNAFSGKTKGNAIAEYLEGTAEAFRQSGKEMQRMKDYSSYWDSLSDDEKLEEARYQIKLYENQVKFSTDAINKAWSKSQKEVFERGKQNHEKKVAQWKEVEQSLLKTMKQEQDIQTAENNRADAEAKINNLMLEISKNYEKLGKDDPAVQLKNYQKELDEIKKKRDKLAEPVEDSDGKIIDTTEAMKQLDALEKNVKKKIAALKIDGKKSWRIWLSDALDVDTELFTKGQEAAKIYVNGLEQQFENAEGLSKILGKKFDASDIIDDQLSEIESHISTLLNIPTPLIDSVFSLDELQQEGTALNELYNEWKKLQNAKETTALEKLQKQIDDLSKSEFELYLESENLENLPTEKIDEIREKFNQLKLESVDDLGEKIGILTEQGLESLNLFDAKSREVIGNLTANLANISFDAVLGGLKEFGQALGEGEDASDSMQRALESMASEILNQLPLLFMQAGLQLIAQGQWALGLGLMAAGLADQVVAGFVNGKKESAKANALGGVYGDEAYTAFAKGGTFTNQIVAKPTYFRFAKGSGFGTGLMGEAGPEAIMPLTRGADGSLGVSATGIGGGDVQVNIPVTVYSDEPVEVHDTEDENGQRKIEILVGSMINQHIAGGKADKALKSRYGLKVQGV